jgi:hypothetical protein
LVYFGQYGILTLFWYVFAFGLSLEEKSGNPELALSLYNKTNQTSIETRGDIHRLGKTRAGADVMVF